MTRHIHIGVLKGFRVVKNVSTQTIHMNGRPTIVHPHGKYWNDTLKQTTIRATFKQMRRQPQVAVCAHKLHKGAIKHPHGAKRHGKCPGDPI